MILNLLKPAGITSHDVVNIVRRVTREKRVGHGGTLDPFASGVLVVGVGRESTRRLEQILKGVDKEYLATLKLGETTSTGDPEGEITSIAEVDKVAALTEEDVKKVLKRFIGEIEQVPPAYSALKIKGVPAYKLARQGQKLSLPSRKVVVKELELLEFLPHPSTKGEGPLLKIRAVVSSGTYIRSLAEGIGRALGVGAYLQELVRIRVGEFRIKDSQSLEDLQAHG